MYVVFNVNFVCAFCLMFFFFFLDFQSSPPEEACHCAMESSDIWWKETWIRRSRNKKSIHRYLLCKYKLGIPPPFPPPFYSPCWPLCPPPLFCFHPHLFLFLRPSCSFFHHPSATVRVAPGGERGVGGVRHRGRGRGSEDRQICPSTWSLFNYHHATTLPNKGLLTFAQSDVFCSSENILFYF